MNRRLTELGFEVTLVQDGDAAGMNGVVQRIPQVFAAGGVGVFYYAGHGVQYKGVNYLLPTDFELTTPDDLPRHSLALNTILQAMNDAGVKIGIIILDACRESPFGTVSDAFGQGLALVDAPGETLIAYATRPGGLAEDGAGAEQPVHRRPGLRARVAQSEHLRRLRRGARQGQPGDQRPSDPLDPGLARSGRHAVPLPSGGGAADRRGPDGARRADHARFGGLEDDPAERRSDRLRALPDAGSAAPYMQLAQRRLSELRAQGREDLPEMGIRLADAAGEVPDSIDSLITECDVVAADPYDNGRITAGVPWGLVNTSIAIRACLRSVAANPNTPRLLFNLGRALDIAERFDEAKSFYRKAADLGYASAFSNLGYMQRTGRGVAADPEAAAELYRQAALRGSSGGRTSLASLYREGIGVPRSNEEALKWYQLAAADGYPGARRCDRPLLSQRARGRAERG